MAAASVSPSPSAPGLTDDEKAIHALGAAMGMQIEQQVKPLKLTPAELELLKKGLSASLAGQKPEYAVDQYMSKLQARAEASAKAMAEAEVGDDVYGEDPSVNRLQERTAELLGFEAALFVPSGTMGNAIAVNLLTERGQEVLTEERSHVVRYELAGLAVNLFGPRRA